MGVCGTSLSVFVIALAERKARNAKMPQVTRQTILAGIMPSEKPLKADRRNKRARQEKIIVFFIRSTTFLFLKKL